jgi:hypothetical protein
MCSSLGGRGVEWPCFNASAIFPKERRWGNEWVCESMPLLSLNTELCNLDSLIKGHCTCSGKLHGLLPSFKITSSLACGRRTRSLDMAGSWEYGVVAVADSAQWVVTAFWGWEGPKYSHPKKKKAPRRLSNIAQGLRMRYFCEDSNENLGCTSSWLTQRLSAYKERWLPYVRAFSQFILLSYGLWRHVVCQEGTDRPASFHRQSTWRW